MLPLLPVKPVLVVLRVLVDVVVRALVRYARPPWPEPDVEAKFGLYSFGLRMVAVEDVAGEEILVCLF